MMIVSAPYLLRREVEVKFEITDDIGNVAEPMMCRG